VEFVRGSASYGESTRELLQSRLEALARMVTLMFAGFYVLGLVVGGTMMPERVVEYHLHPVKIANLLVVLGTFATWRVLARWRLPPRLLWMVDAGLVFGINVASAIGLSHLPKSLALQLAPMLFLVLTLTLRAAVVPSPALRTTLIGALCSLPAMGAAYALSTEDPFGSELLTPFHVMIGMAAWCTASVAVTAVTSNIIYGLHEQVRDARKLGQYTLIHKIGEGGMGSVYRAKHALLRRPTAVKLLLPARAGPENLARFEREVQLTSRLSHPNTVAVYDYGRTDDGVLYYAMEYIDGVTLEQLVERDGPQPAARVIYVLMQIAGALTEAHDLGLIHRDVKPGNVLLCERGRLSDFVKVVDFGLVKQLGPAGSPDVTQEKTIAGTPLYLAPEAILSGNVDARADLYALGAVGYFLLTGLPVFEGKSVVEVCSQHLHAAPIPPSVRSNVDVPAELERVILRCLEKNPAARPSDAAQLMELLAGCAVDAPWTPALAQSWWARYRAQVSS
jgi:serine/threonine-protein kinase